MHSFLHDCNCYAEHSPVRKKCARNATRCTGCGTFFFVVTTFSVRTVPIVWNRTCLANADCISVSTSRSMLYLLEVCVLSVVGNQYFCPTKLFNVRWHFNGHHDRLDHFSVRWSAIVHHLFLTLQSVLPVRLTILLCPTVFQAVKPDSFFVSCPRNLFAFPFLRCVISKWISIEWFEMIICFPLNQYCVFKQLEMMYFCCQSYL